MREKARTDAIVRDKIRLEDYVHEWYLPDVEKRVRFSTLREYKSDLRLRILPALGNKYIDAITREDVQRLIDACKTPKFARRARDVSRQVLNHAKEHAFVKDNPAEGAFKFPAPSIYPEEHNGVWLTSFDEIDAFLDGMQDARLHMVALLVCVLVCVKVKYSVLIGLMLTLKNALYTYSEHMYLKKADTRSCRLKLTRAIGTYLCVNAYTTNCTPVLQL